MTRLTDEQKRELRIAAELRKSQGAHGFSVGLSVFSLADIIALLDEIDELAKALRETQFDLRCEQELYVKQTYPDPDELAWQYARDRFGDDAQLAVYSVHSRVAFIAGWRAAIGEK